MENVHKSATRNWISESFSLLALKDLFSHIFAPHKQVAHKISQEELEEVDKYFNDCLDCALSPDLTSGEISEENVKLHTVRNRVKDLEKRRLDVNYSNVMYQGLRSYNYPKKELPMNPSGSEFIAVEKPEIILTVQIYRPKRFTPGIHKEATSPLANFEIDQEFAVLGNQLLTELRDKIDCLSDRFVSGELSDNPDFQSELSCKNLYKSGFFYISGTFYNDMRHADCRDYSEPIMKWSEEPFRTDIGPFKKALMESTKFIDLEVQFGYPYLYSHQGNCEHFIVFTDAQMFTSHHCQNVNEYPRYVTIRPKRRTYCNICHKYTPEYVVYDNKRLPENPYMFCDMCFRSFNYDANGQKIGEFRAYKHTDRSLII